MRPTILVVLVSLLAFFHARAQTPTPLDPTACDGYLRISRDLAGGVIQSQPRNNPARSSAAAQEATATRRGQTTTGTPGTTTSPMTTAQAPRRWHIGETFRDCADCPEMVVIPAGSFTMGSPASETGRYNDEGPQRNITIARSFAVQQTDVTRGQYAAFTRASGRPAGNNCYTDRAVHGTWAQDPNGTWRDPGFSQGEDHPVVCVSWDDAQAYVQWLNAKTRGGYRLLSEAEWEYAARAGTTSAYPWGSDGAQACAYANGSDATFHPSYPNLEVMTCNDGALYTSAVGTYQHNAFGLSDMTGNVWGWVEDCYEATLDTVPTDGSARETNKCSERVDRGGSWFDVSRGLRSANRDRHSPSLRYSDIGFRVARTLN